MSGQLNPADRNASDDGRLHAGRDGLPHLDVSRRLSEGVGRPTGIVFSNLTMSSGTLTCTGAGSANYSCSIINSSNNATVAAQVSFVDSSGNLVAYSADAETVTVVYTGGKNPGANSLTVAAGATTSSASPAPNISRSGSNNAQMTFTFALSGGQTVTATVTIN